ncbi:uncharacterized protein isoform X2 [Macaca fascicularis]|uniref:uncharacterized protein isoform X2 n=1 Tax=Macaca fascicularis TaxID=9541 RepID=UPI0032B03FDF
MDTRRSTLEIITESGAGRGTNRGEGTSSVSKGGQARPKAWAGGHVLPWPPAALPSRRPGPRRRILTAVQQVSLCARARSPASFVLLWASLRSTSVPAALRTPPCTPESLRTCKKKELAEAKTTTKIFNLQGKRHIPPSASVSVSSRSHAGGDRAARSRLEGRRRRLFLSS